MIRRDRDPTLLGLGLLVGIVVVAEIAAGLCVISACREVARIVAAALRMIRRDRDPTLLGLGLLVGIVVVAEIAAGLCVISACREVARIVAAALG